MTEYLPLKSSGAEFYDFSKPALLFGSKFKMLEQTAMLLDQAGLRLVAKLPIDEAKERLDQQGATGLVWLELGADDAGPALDELLDALKDLADAGTIVIAAAPIELVDLLDARLHHRHVEILVNADEPQRLAALVSALSGAVVERSTGDASKDNAVRLRQLSDEMGRIAATLARLSTGPGGPAVKPGAGTGQTPAVDAEAVRAVIRARRLRSRFFSEELFADPAWDMLLDLLQAEIAQLRVPVSSLCIAAAVPATTALRWIKTMTEQGLFVRRADPHDGRRVFVELAPAASDAMRRYFAEVGSPAVV